MPMAWNMWNRFDTFGVITMAANSSPIASKGKPVSRRTLETWPDDIRKSFDFKFKDDRAVHAKCKICAKHAVAIQNKYKRENWFKMY